MSGRAKAGKKPWDESCKVTTFVDGLDAMSAIRESLELAITEARAAPAGQKGKVFFTGWRFNSHRDLSTANTWVMGDWSPNVSGRQAAHDQTALGLVLRLMQAGVKVRMLLWYPPALSNLKFVGFGAHIADHLYVARVVAAESKRLSGTGEPLGIVALDMRTADSTTSGSHHQKTVVIRGATTSVAYVGGVDLAFTRRDAPQLQGDWQSGKKIPIGSDRWPHDNPPPPEPQTDYTSVDPPTGVEIFTDVQESDLPTEIYGESSTALDRQIWHDQHLRLEGPIVETLEWQFKERWEDTTDARLFDIDGSFARQNWRIAQVIFSTADAFTSTGIKPLLPYPAPASAVGGSTRVQMWRTIPWRETRLGPPFERAEFTVMGGIANAVQQAKQLIWMFDQYFWSVPLARLINAQLHKPALSGLHVIVVLPPHADSQVATAHLARANALNALTAGLTGPDRVAVYNLWLDPKAPQGVARNRGIYVHAKAHTYDGDLLVCGSANLNRRSFTCDSEIALAVLDPAVVTSHQTKLWSYLFNGAARPTVDLSSASWGKNLFDAFKQAVQTGSSILISDPWRDPDPKLPNGRKRDQSPWLFGMKYNSFLDPSSVTTDVEENVADGTAKGREATLADIVNRLERDRVGSFWTYRHP
jgi:phosphatidylserine/phosphatidylglycerophosphate/cardiolipin synthase-like enzyme